MSTALQYPLAGDRTVRTLVVGAVLSVLGVLVVPGVFVAGFYGRILARSATGDATPPTFSDWRALASHGLKTWIVTALYVTAAVVLGLTVGVLAIILGPVVGNGVGVTVGAVALGLIAAAAIGTVSFPVWFFVPAALTRFALTGRIGAALELRTVLRTAVKPAYLVRWAAGIVLVLAGTGVYLALSSGIALPAVGDPTGGIPLLGHAVGASINFYCQVVAFYLFGRGYAVAVSGSDHDPLLDAVESEMRVSEDDGWGHSGTRPAWGELRRRTSED